MTKSKKIFLIVAVAVIVFVLGTFFELRKETVTAGVFQGQEYSATTTRTSSAGTYWLAKSTANTPYCAVGNVTVASSSATTLTLWNATSTTDVASTTFATLVADLPEGTYTYDATCDRGLIIETPAGFNGEYTITWR